MKVYDTKTKKYLEDGVFYEESSWGESCYFRIVIALDGTPLILCSDDGGKNGIHEHYVDFKEYEGRFIFEKL